MARKFTLVPPFIEKMGHVKPYWKVHLDREHPIVSESKVWDQVSVKPRPEIPGAIPYVGRNGTTIKVYNERQLRIIRQRIAHLYNIHTLYHNVSFPGEWQLSFENGPGEIQAHCEYCDYIDVLWIDESDN